MIAGAPGLSCGGPLPLHRVWQGRGVGGGKDLLSWSLFTFVVKKRKRGGGRGGGEEEDGERQGGREGGGEGAGYGEGEEVVGEKKCKDESARGDGAGQSGNKALEDRCTLTPSPLTPPPPALPPGCFPTS